jgi:hypothetical protein
MLYYATKGATFLRRIGMIVAPHSATSIRNRARCDCEFLCDCCLYFMQKSHTQKGASIAEYAERRFA